MSEPKERPSMTQIPRSRLVQLAKELRDKFKWDADMDAADMLLRVINETQRGRKGRGK